MESKVDFTEVESRTVYKTWGEQGGDEERLANRSLLDLHRRLGSGVLWHSRVNMINKDAHVLFLRIEERIWNAYTIKK